MAQLGDLAAVKEKVLRKLGNVSSGKLLPTVAAQEEAVRDALDEYSGSFPRELVYQAAGDGTTQRFVLSSTITDWVAETSQVQEVHEADDPDSDDESVYVWDDEAWDVRKSSAGAEVLFLAGPIPSSVSLRILYTRPHEIEDLDSATATTVPEKHAEAFALLAAAYQAAWISRTADDQANQTLGVDQIDYGALSTRWKENARKLRQAAIERFAPGEFSGGSAGTSVDWERRTLLGRRERVGH